MGLLLQATNDTQSAEGHRHQCSAHCRMAISMQCLEKFRPPSEQQRAVTHRPLQMTLHAASRKAPSVVYYRLQEHCHKTKNIQTSLGNSKQAHLRRRHSSSRTQTSSISSEMCGSGVMTRQYCSCRAASSMMAPSRIMSLAVLTVCSGGGWGAGPDGGGGTYKK